MVSGGKKPPVRITEAMIKTALDGTFTSLTPTGLVLTTKVPSTYIPSHHATYTYKPPSSARSEHALADIWLEAMGLA